MRVRVRACVLVEISSKDCTNVKCSQTCVSLTRFNVLCLQAATVCSYRAKLKVHTQSDCNRPVCLNLCRFQRSNRTISIVDLYTMFTLRSSNSNCHNFLEVNARKCAAGCPGWPLMQQLQILLNHITLRAMQVIFFFFKWPNNRLLEKYWQDFQDTLVLISFPTMHPLPV